VRARAAPGLHEVAGNFFPAPTIDAGKPFPYIRAIDVGPGMPTLVDHGAFKITVYVDHNPPHVHVIVSDGSQAKLRIDNGELMAGSVRPKVLRDAREWLAEHREEVEAAWRRLNP